MAITTYRNSKNAGWAKTDVIYQLEEAFSWLGWHGGTVSGIVTGVQSYSGWNTVGTSNTHFDDTRPKSGGTNIGIGSTCSFVVQRSGGAVNAVYVNRPGAGYADGDSLTIDASDIGGGTDMTVVVQVDETEYGSTSTFYDKGVDSNTAPWGVLRLEVEANKVYGDTYWGFQVSGNNLYMSSGTSFMPFDDNSTYVQGHRYANSFRGLQYQELLTVPTGTTHRYLTSSVNSTLSQEGVVPFASSNSFQLDLSVFRSALDTNFAVLSYRHPDKSSTSIDTNTYGTFFLHNFTSSLFDLDHLYNGGRTRIERYMAGPYLNFYTNLANNNSSNDYWQGRSALSGYMTGSSYVNTDYQVLDRQYPLTYSVEISADERRMYYRNNDNSSTFRGDIGDTNYLNKNPDSVNYNAVVKGIPLSSTFVPCPYYLPDDFVFIQFDYNAPDQNIQQWDTITVSGSEVYTVIDAAYNQTTRTRGIAFCARTT